MDENYSEGPVPITDVHWAKYIVFFKNIEFFSPPVNTCKEQNDLSESMPVNEINFNSTSILFHVLVIVASAVCELIYKEIVEIM